jgi:hypothetical protein
VPLNPNAALARPDPPAHLSARERPRSGATRSMKPGWFTLACAPPLETYSCEVLIGEKLSEELRKLAAFRGSFQVSKPLAEARSTSVSSFTHSK